MESVQDIGTRLWDSSVALARLLQYLHDTPSYHGALSPGRLAGRSVCELGAGCGLAGLAMALHGVASVAFTDLPEVMPHLEVNVAANRATVQTAASGAASEAAAPVQLWCTGFAWGTDAREAGLPLASEANAFDIVLGADSIYLAEQIEPLMDALRQLCASQTLVLLALERRSPDVWQRFDEALRGQFRVREVPLQCLEKAMAHSAVPGAARGRVDRLAVLLCQMCSASPDILLNEDI